MKKSLTIVMLICMLVGWISSDQIYAQNSNQDNKSTNNAMVNKNAKLRHVVLFAFKKDSSPEDIHKIEKAFSALPGKIPQIKNYEWGINNSPEGLNDGLTHCFLVTFDSEEDRAVYLPHPAHKAFVKMLNPHLEKAVVVDYWAHEE